MSQPPIEPTPASWADLLSARNLLRSLALTGGIALHAVNIYIVATVLPTVVREIGGLEYYAWNTTLFVVASIAGSVLATRLIQRCGARAAYLLALVLFCVGATVCAAAPSMPWLLFGRTVQGLGGGLLFALAYALIRLIFDEVLWGRVMALVSGVWGAATLLGPAVGGIFAQAGHWRWAFLAVLPVAAALALIVIGQLERKPAGGAAGALPLGRIGLLVASVLAISLTSLAPRPGWNVAGIGAGLELLLWMVALDRKATVRLMPRGGYALSSPLGAIYACMALLIIGVSSEVFIPYFLQTIHGHTPLAAGYMTAFVSFGWTAASLLSSGRTGAAADRMVRLAAPIVLASLLALMLATPNPAAMAGDAGTALYCMLLAAAGFGIGLGWPHLAIRVFNGASAGDETLAASSITTVQLYATALAAALAGVVANGAGISDPGGVAGAQNAAWWLFGSFAAAPALALVLTGRILR